MKKNKSLYHKIALFVIFLSSFLLSGCQLAQETGNGNGAKDKLCGVFISVGLPDLQVSDWQPEASDFKADRNGNLTLDQEDWPLAYNNIAEGELTDSGNSIKFKGLNGYYLGIRDYTDGNGNKISSFMADQGFQDFNYKTEVTDESLTNSAEATFSVSPECRETININPVFQRADESYYAVTGEMGFIFTGQSSGTIFSKTYDSTFTITEGSKTTIQKTSYKINIAVVDEVQQIFIKEMNQKDELIKTTEYRRDDPDRFILDDQTKYVIVEEEMKNVLTGNYIKRTVYSFDHKDSGNETISHDCSFSEDNGVISIKNVTFAFKE